MNVYTCNTFNGYWPVGSSAVIIAESLADAKERLESELKRVGLDQEIPSEDIKLVETGMPDVIILTDGNY